MAQYTPGPWAIGNGDPATYARNHAICSGPVIIGKANGLGYPLGKGWAAESEANARLMAAAPELLDALKDALSALETAAHRDPDQAGLYYCPAARAAIAKAEGD